MGADDRAGGIGRCGARRRELGRRTLGGRDVDVGENDPRTVGEQLGAEGLPDAGSTAGDDGRPAGERCALCCHRPPPTRALAGSTPVLTLRIGPLRMDDAA